jgi:general secretion pathway protein K
VLVIVLITLLFTAAALVALVEKAGDDLLVETREATARRLRREAYSVLEVTLAVLEQFRSVNGGLHSPAEGWSDPLAFAGWEPPDGLTAEVQFEDESGKISLPHVDLATLLNLFDSWGMPQKDAERLADALLSWMKKDYVPTSTTFTDYEQGALPYGPPLRSLRSFSELAAIDDAREVFYDEDGRPNELWSRVAAAVSLFDFAQTNINGARGDVLSAFGIKDPSQQQQLEEYLSGTGRRAQLGPSFFENAADAARMVGAGALPPNTGAQISALRVIVILRQGRTVFRVSAVVAPASGGATTVQSTAAETEASPQEQTKAADTTAESAKTQASAKKLNYPFTFLEIRENAEISPVTVAPTKA